MYDVICTQENRINTTAAAWATDLYQGFLAYLDNSPKTIATYEQAIKQFVLWAKLNGIKEPTREDIIRYRDELKATGHKATTIQNYIIALRIFFRWVHLQTGYPDIAEHIKGAKLTREHKKDALTPQQVRLVLSSIDTSTAKGKRDYALLLLMVTCGLRTIEIERAKVEDMRIIGGEFTALYVQGKGKEEKSTYVKLPEATEKAIRAYLTATKNTAQESPLFISISNHGAGEAMTTRSIRRIVKEAFRNVGLDSERLTAHSMRHTAVTLALKAGQDIRQVQEFARHSNINTTLIYAHDLDAAHNSCSNSVCSVIM